VQDNQWRPAATMHQNSPLLRLCLFDPTFLKSINKYIRKTPSKGTREEKRTKVQTKDNTRKHKMHNGGALRAGIK